MAHYTTQMPNVASEIFDGEVIVADFVGGSYYSLTGTGALIWQGLRAGHSSEDVAGWLSRHFQQPGETLTADVDSFVLQLVQSGLAAPLDSAPSAGPLPEVAPGSYAGPQMERHDDLQDLLLLDPVHDVAQAGWPHKPTDIA